MGMYVFITNEDRVAKRKVTDVMLNGVFKEALKYDKSLMIDEIVFAKSKWFKTVYETHYEVWHETPALDGSAYQARVQMSATGDEDIIYTYLYGIINGANAHKHSLNLPL